MRLAAALLLLGVLGLVVASRLSLRAGHEAPLAPDRAGIEQLLNELEQPTADAVSVDLATLYAGRRELLDPRLALPVWHTLSRDPAVAVSKATRSCPTAEVGLALDAVLAKALRFHAATCDPSASATRDALVEQAPYLHPSGRSYAALALERGAPPGWAAAHRHAFHVLELAALPPALLDATRRAARWRTCRRAAGRRSRAATACS